MAVLFLISDQEMASVPRNFLLDNIDIDFADIRGERFTTPDQAMSIRSQSIGSQKSISRYDVTISYLVIIH